MKSKLGALGVLVALSSVVLMLGYTQYAPPQKDRPGPDKEDAPSIKREAPVVKPKPERPSHEPSHKPDVAQEVTLYVPQASGDDLKLTAVRQKVAAKTPIAALKALAAYDGPGDPPLPKGAKPLSVKVDPSGTAVADFSGEIVENFPGGSRTEQVMLASIVNTLTQFPSIKRVTIHVDGKEVDSIGGHMELSEPLERDTTLLAHDSGN